MMLYAHLNHRFLIKTVHFYIWTSAVVNKSCETKVLSSINYCWSSHQDGKVVIYECCKPGVYQKNKYYLVALEYFTVIESYLHSLPINSHVLAITQHYTVKFVYMSTFFSYIKPHEPNWYLYFQFTLIIGCPTCVNWLYSLLLVTWKSFL